METRQDKSAKPQAAERGVFRCIGDAFRGWLGMYPGCGCHENKCEPGDPMAQLPDTLPVGNKKK